MPGTFRNSCAATSARPTSSLEWLACDVKAYIEALAAGGTLIHQINFRLADEPDTHVGIKTLTAGETRAHHIKFLLADVSRDMNSCIEAWKASRTLIHQSKFCWPMCLVTCFHHRGFGGW